MQGCNCNGAALKAQGQLRHQPAIWRWNWWINMKHQRLQFITQNRTKTSRDVAGERLRLLARTQKTTFPIILSWFHKGGRSQYANGKRPMGSGCNQRMAWVFHPSLCCWSFAMIAWLIGSKGVAEVELFKLSMLGWSTSMRQGCWLLNQARKGHRSRSSSFVSSPEWAANASVLPPDKLSRPDCYDAIYSFLI